MPIRPVIMCGGTGKRLWPVSRTSMPKQFHALVGADTLLQATLRRVSGPEFEAPLFVANEEHRFLVRDQASEIRPIAPESIVLEPFGRNTAAVAVAASLIEIRRGGELILLLPSDHHIGDPGLFEAMVRKAEPAARAGFLCLFGVSPSRPEIGYGYIRASAEAVPDPAGPSLRVAEFIEKPDRARARRMLANGDYLWNTGMCLFSAASLLDEARALKPALVAAVERGLDRGAADGAFLRIDPTAFAEVEAISLDYAILERSRRTAVLPTALPWSDLGAWNEIQTARAADLAQDPNSNVPIGRNLLLDTTDTLAWSDGQLVATLGVRGLMVVATRDAVLVADRSRAQGVRELVDQLEAAGHEEAGRHPETHRPWGSYLSLVSGERFQVKLIRVKPGARLSRQLHRHRAEHWIVVKGAALISCGDRSFTLGENESTFIAQGEVHRLENPGPTVLELIEVQSGAYLGEDDILRVEDEYGRARDPRP